MDFVKSRREVIDHLQSDKEVTEKFYKELVFLIDFFITYAAFTQDVNSNSLSDFRGLLIDMINHNQDDY